MDIWNRISITQEDTGTPCIAFLRFLKESAGSEAFAAKKSITLKTNILEIADQIALCCDGILESPNDSYLFVRGTINGKPVLSYISMDRNTSGYDDDGPMVPYTPARKVPSKYSILKSRIAQYGIETIGSREAIEHVFRHLDLVFSNQHFARLNWWYAAEHGIQYKRIYLPPVTTELHPEFYPDIANGPKDFIRSYLDADEAVLLMAGPPGTGKTTLLRHMIVENKLTAHVIYDEKLMENDKFFQSFLMESESNMLVIEDADTILTSRERDGNKLMSRFLNVSDGLIKLPNKKLVFTTNLTDFARVDTALLRPGRCFAVLHTRALNLTEAQSASKVGGFPTPTERKEYTLADLFNQGKTSAGVRRIGFGG